MNPTTQHMYHGATHMLILIHMLIFFISDSHLHEIVTFAFWGSQSDTHLYLNLKQTSGKLSKNWFIAYSVCIVDGLPCWKKIKKINKKNHVTVPLTLPQMNSSKISINAVPFAVFVACLCEPHVSWFTSACCISVRIWVWGGHGCVKFWQAACTLVLPELVPFEMAEQSANQLADAALTRWHHAL